MIHLSIRWTVTRRAFVVDGNTADDILNSFLTQPTWCIALSVISFLLMTLMADFVTVRSVSYEEKLCITIYEDLEVLGGLEPQLEGCHCAISARAYWSW